MLLFGRRLSWLFGGLAMALVGLIIAAIIVTTLYGGPFKIVFNPDGELITDFSPLARENMRMVIIVALVGVLLGTLVGALILARFPRAASTLAGFIGGIFLLLQLFELYSANIGGWLSLPFRVAVGIAVAIIARRNPDTSLIVLSSVIGTILIAQGLKFYPYSNLSAITTLGLMLLGVLYQTRALYRRQKQAVRSVTKLDATT